MAKEPQINLKEIAIPTISNDDLKKLLDENLRLTQEIHEMTHKIKSYITFQKFMSFVYMVLIIGPIIFSIFYLPPLLKQVFGSYSELLNPTNPSALLQNVNLELQKNQNLLK
ncbi:MAG: hypothetical protein WCG01_05370 [bacterium]